MHAGFGEKSHPPKWLSGLQNRGDGPVLGLDVTPGEVSWQVLLFSLEVTGARVSSGMMGTSREGEITPACWQLPGLAEPCPTSHLCLVLFPSDMSTFFLPACKSLFIPHDPKHMLPSQ